MAAFVDRVNQPTETAPTRPTQTREKIEVENTAQQPRGPRDIPLGLRYFILKRDSFRCVVCGRSPATEHGLVLHVDHFVPWAKGGATIAKKLRTLCVHCNLGKGDSLESEI